MQLYHGDLGSIREGLETKESWNKTDQGCAVGSLLANLLKRSDLSDLD